MKTVAFAAALAGVLALGQAGFAYEDGHSGDKKKQKWEKKCEQKGFKKDSEEFKKCLADMKAKKKKKGGYGDGHS